MSKQMEIMSQQLHRVVSWRVWSSWTQQEGIGFVFPGLGTLQVGRNNANPICFGCFDSFLKKFRGVLPKTKITITRVIVWPSRCDVADDRGVESLCVCLC